MNLPKNCVVDTNVPKTANLAIQPDPTSNIPDECVLACIEAIEHVINGGILFVDSGGEIFDEYRRQLSLKGQPGVGDRFLKWVHDHQYDSKLAQRVQVTKNGDSYEEFPEHDGLKEFDVSDRKFVAVANAAQGQPSILQATDSKWWGWSRALKDVGVPVVFLCPDYVESKFSEKMGP